MGPSIKQCACCKETKHKSDFGFASRYSDKLYVYCRACVAQKGQILKQNREVTPALKAKWKARTDLRRSTPEGREEIRAANRKYLANKRQDPIYRAADRLRSLIYHKTHPNGLYAKIRKDPIFALSVRVRGLIKMALKNKQVAKASKTEVF